MTKEECLDILSGKQVTASSTVNYVLLNDTLDLFEFFIIACQENDLKLIKSYFNFLKTAEGKKHLNNCNYEEYLKVGLNNEINLEIKDFLLNNALSSIIGSNGNLYNLFISLVENNNKNFQEVYNRLSILLSLNKEIEDKFLKEFTQTLIYVTINKDKEEILQFLLNQKDINIDHNIVIKYASEGGIKSIEILKKYFHIEIKNLDDTEFFIRNSLEKYIFDPILLEYLYFNGARFFDKKEKYKNSSKERNSLFEKIDAYNIEQSENDIRIIKLLTLMEKYEPHNIELLKEEISLSNSKHSENIINKWILKSKLFSNLQKHDLIPRKNSKNKIKI